MNMGGQMDNMGMDGSMGHMTATGMHDEMMGGDGLDEIINQNNQELQRRRTVDFNQGEAADRHNRRSSMLEFGSNDDNGLGDFGFDPAPAQPSYPTNGNNMANMANNMNLVQKVANLRKARSKEDMVMNPAYSTFGSGFDQMQNMSAYSSPMHPSAQMNMSPMHYLPNDGDLSLDFGDSSNNMGAMNFSNITQQPMFTQSPIHTNFQHAFGGPSNQSMGVKDGSTDEQMMMEKVAQMSLPGPMRAPQSGSVDQLRSRTGTGSGGQTPTQKSESMSAGTPQKANASSTPQPNGNQMQVPASNTPYNTNNNTNNSAGPAMDNLPDIKEDVPLLSRFPNAYSASGFDMLGVLMRVANRKKPEINIGPVDLSCAFVVCDISQHDLPIVYCSEVFERLTGYTKHEILGRNCRFLQSPDGKVQSGIKRKYVDDKSVLHLKNKIAKREEVQLSLINYRKGGQPFMNLLTMIPVTWDNDEFKYYVGFQVDLVEQPGSVAGRNPDGSYAINYHRNPGLPRYFPNLTPENQQHHRELGQTIGRDEVSTVLTTIANGESELSKRIWDKVLLENTDDVVHVLSLKGLFLYLSPACRKVLEYDAAELVGTALSSVCHPSDIVPVTRELKDTSSGAAINVVFRIRRKHSGYTWFESHGTLHTEQGKGRKCIILVGRERPVYALTRPGLEVGDSEVWSKLSTSGMVLFVASNVRLLLDRTPEDLIGTSMQALMRAESRAEFGRALEQARTGKRTSFKHDLQNRRGQILQAQTLLFPGDAEEGTKPTFFVAQTRLLKMTRTIASQRPTVPASPRTDAASAGSVTPAPSVALSRTGGGATPMSGKTQSSSIGDQKFITAAGGDALPVGNQDEILASEDNIFDELKTTRSTSWQFELRQMEKQNRILAEELQALISRKKKRKRRKGAGQLEKDCANCHTRVTPEWRRGPSGNRDLCNSCGLRWAKQNGRVSPRKSVSDGGKTPSRLSQSPDQVNKNRIASSPQHISNVPQNPSNLATTSTVLPSGNQEQQAIGSQQPNNFQIYPPQATSATASAMAGSIDSHIAKTAKLNSQNMQGSIADRHELPIKIDEDVDLEDEDDAEGEVDIT